MDRVERKVTKRNEIRMRNKMAAEAANEFATLGDYREALKDTYQKAEEQRKHNKQK
ncbi:hypothetical protein [Sporosarcina sp. ITBMC105]